MENQLKGKKILFISPKFFGYEKIIQDRLTQLGASVLYFDERPSNKAFAKGIMRLNRKILSRQIRRYYSDIFSKVKNESYDYLFVIKGEVIPDFFVHLFKENNPNCKMLLMLWDSINNYEYVVEKSQLFNKTFSFDKEDCKRYNFEFRPLFYDEKYLEIAKNPQQILYDICFIGTVHSDRLKILELIKNKLGNNYRFYYYLFIPSKLLYYFKKIYIKEFRDKKINYFKFNSLKKQDVIDNIAKSRIIIDIEHPGQTGLTMRTIEMLGAGRKIITTNQSIKDYDFYCEENIYIIDRNNIEIADKFLKCDFKKIDEEILTYYSLKGFLNQIFTD